jgi:ABC-type phosphate/phosphonate transport system permease subunit
MLSHKNKMTTLYWIAVFGLFLTTVYSFILGILGARTMKMIRYIYNQNKKSNNS